MKNVINIAEGKVRILGTDDINGVYTKYTVVAGDTLGKIAKENGTTVEYLAKVNEIKNVDLIEVDQVILVPEKKVFKAAVGPDIPAIKVLNIGEGKIRIIGIEDVNGAYEEYTVVAGDTLGKIAKDTGTTVEVLAKVNGIENVDLIEVGQILYVPSK